ncbi:hypothetical protein D6005_12345 [Escherichia coli]|nr:hypothetical protein [Escherichia coli]EEV5829301.1 hypothetical protein [Escherichia coli]EEV6731227.1 hypothetical protein [Escherichia coli]KYR40368.1 hypothetical protein AML05_14295 [Escherichia coli]KYR63725.1 hypothetical protein AML08_02030 [Escherichia coli]
MLLSRLYRETIRNCHLVFGNQKKKAWNFNKYYFSGSVDFIIKMTSWILYFYKNYMRLKKSAIKTDFFKI